jgi:hypothetical protein
MTSEEFIKRWKDVILLMFTTLGFIYATFAFIRDRVYVRDDLQATAIGDVDTRQTPENQDRISLRLAVVNAGTRDAAVLQAEIVALRKESDGYSWVRIFPPLGEGFEAKVLKPGEITIVSLVTDANAHDKYFRNPNYARTIDATHHEFAEGVRIRSMDSKGRLFTLLYPFSQFKVPNDITSGPTDGYTFDCHPHELLVNLPETIPPLATKYDGDAYDCR